MGIVWIAWYDYLRGDFLVLNAQDLFLAFFSLEFIFHTKNKSTAQLLFDTEISNHLTHPKSTMISPVVTIAQKIIDKMWIKTKIGVRSDVKAKVGYMEDKTREVRSSRMSEEVVIFFRMWWGRINCYFN